MDQGTDYFSDLLLPGETIVAALGAPGPTVERRIGQERTWFQVAFTPTRFLVVRMSQAPMSSKWQPVQRFGVDRGTIRIARFPRTPHSSARLEVTGAGEPVSLRDIDEASIFPQVEPFLAAYGRTVEGAGLIYAQQPTDEDYASADTRKLLIVLGVCLLMVILCCGCSGLIGGLRALLA